MKLKLRWIVLIFLTVWIGIMFFDISDLKKDRSKIELDKATIESRVSELEDRLRNDELAMLLMDAHRPVKSNPSDSIVWDYIKNSPAWYPEIVMAQYVIESGHGKSKLSREFNNYFGMKLTSKSSRMTTQIPKLSGFREYGVYSNWKMSVIDRLLWDWFVFESIPTKEDYINKLCAIYAEDPNYKSIITKESKNWK